MRFSTLMQHPSLGRQIISGFGLTLFLGAFFVLPLCAVLSVCSMSCCEPSLRTEAATMTSAGMAACATECSIRTEEAKSTTATPVAPRIGASPQVPAATLVAALPETPLILTSTTDRSPGFPRRESSLQILNSTFRI